MPDFIHRQNATKNKAQKSFFIFVSITLWFKKMVHKKPCHIKVTAYLVLNDPTVLNKRCHSLHLKRNK